MHTIISYSLVYPESTQTVKQHNQITNPIVIIPKKTPCRLNLHLMLDNILQSLFVIEMIKGMVQEAHGINYCLQTGLVNPIHTETITNPNI